MTSSPAPQRGRKARKLCRTTKGRKLPKARIMYAAKPELADMFVVADEPWQISGPASPVLVLPCLSQKSAKARLAFERLTFEQKVESIAQTAYEADYCPQAEPEWHEMKDDGPVRLVFTQRARAILSLLGEVQK